MSDPDVNDSTAPESRIPMPPPSFGFLVLSLRTQAEVHLGLMRFDLHPLPADPALIVHLTLVLTLMVIFPFSKLLHAPGLFFSPSRNQADDSRERRHVPPARLESTPRRA